MPSAHSFTKYVRILAGLTLVFSLCHAIAAQPVPIGMSLADWATLSEARALNKNRVIALFLLRDVGADALARFESSIRAAGGSAIFADAQFGYVRVQISTKKYESLISDPRVAASRIDGADYLKENIPAYEEPFESSGNQNKEAAFAVSNPSLDLSKEMIGSSLAASSFLGLSDWLARHPSFDGRGVTIATSEPLGDILDNPSFTQALSLDGQRVTKVARIFASPVRFADDGQSAESNILPVRGGELSKASAILEVRTDQDGFFSVDGRRYKAPMMGDYLFQQQSLGNGFYTPADRLYSILWKKGEKFIWIDSNDDHNFDDGEVLRDFNQSHDIGHLPRAPTTMPAADHRLAFVLYIDPDSGLPHLLAGDNLHSTWTAGLMAGHNFGGGAAGAAAPNARLAAQFGLTAKPQSISEILEGDMQAILAADTDVLSSSVGVGDDMSNLPDSFAARVMDRVVNSTRKPQFWAAGNRSAQTSSLEMLSVAANVMGVGAYYDAAVLRALGGYALEREGFVAPYSYGPTNSGTMKPDFLAPIGGVTTAPPWLSASVPAGRLPPGLGWVPGTSTAAPAAASMAADLISAAKQSSVPYDASRIYWAMKAGAHFFPDWPAQSQGAGLINLPRSWELLTRAAQWPEWRLAPAIEVRAPIHTRWTEFTHKTAGSGLYEREGWSPGDQGERILTFIRHSGPAAPVRYALRWLGNDGSFAIRGRENNEITLQLNKPLQKTLHVGPLGWGAHSATLELLDWQERLPVAWTAVTVIAADGLTARNIAPYSIDQTVHRQTARPAHHFIRVPEGTRALKIEVSGAAGLRMAANAPLEMEAGSSYSALDRVWETPPITSWLVSEEKAPSQNRTYLAGVPKRGVWEFVMLDRTGFQLEAEHVDNEYSFRATALAASLSAAVYRDHSVQVNINNQMGALENAHVQVEYGVERDVKLDLQHAVETLEVPANTRSLWLRGISTKTHEPVRLWIYCDAKSQKERPSLLEVPFDPRQTVTVRRPIPGTWKVVPNEADLKKGAVNLETIVTSSEYGDVVVSSPAPRRSGERWTETLALAERSAMPRQGESRAILIELQDAAAGAKTQGSADSELPQRPLAVGQTVIRVAARE